MSGTSEALPRSIDVWEVGQVLRDARDSDGKKRSTPKLIGDFVNLYAATLGPSGKMIPFDSGINPLAQAHAIDGPRVPAILIASSPHKIGRTETPWQDHFEPDNGYIRYYGDNRAAGVDPASKRGNKALLPEFATHSHHDPLTRRGAVPVLFFRRVAREQRVKGYAMFQGFGLVASVELVTQFSETVGGSFPNYAFEFLVLSMAAEHETFDWAWIEKRRDPTISLDETVDAAPASWGEWIAHGKSALDRVRRRVSKLLVEPKQAQLPEPGSAEAKVLDAIHAYYTGKNARSEALAAIIAERVVAPPPEQWLNGGLTRASGDGGIDFIARLDVGSGFDAGNLGPAKLVVLGQAKCERLDRPTHGRHIARTVARLRRGWIGVYVTTSFYSPATQREVIEDRYPIVLVHGRRVAEEVFKMCVERGGLKTEEFLDSVDATYGRQVALGDPEELLLR